MVDTNSGSIAYKNYMNQNDFCKLYGISCESLLCEIKARKKNIINQLIQISSEAAPTFHEANRIKLLERILKRLGLNPTIDSAGNLKGHLNCSSSANKSFGILLVAHVDSVLKPEKKPFKKAGKIYGHGVCDNGAGLVSLVTVLDCLQNSKLSLPCKLYYGFTVQEEGLGAKRGMSYLISHSKKIGCVINFESHHLGRIVNSCLGQYRLKVKINTSPGGHSFKDFGNPSATDIAIQLVHQLSILKIFKREHTTWNISGLVSNNKINSISTEASFLLELRSISKKALFQLKCSFEKLIKKYRKIASIKLEVIADVPAISLPTKAPVYLLVKKVHRTLKINSFFQANNCDGDISLAAGIPTVTLGSSRGGGTHTQNEYVEIDSLVLGTQQNILSTLFLAAYFSHKKGEEAH